MSQQGNRFSVKRSTGSPIKSSKHQDKTTLISSTDDGEMQGTSGGTSVGAGVVLGANGTATSFYGSVMKSKRKSGKLLYSFI